MRFTQNTFSAHDTRMIARVTREHLSKQGTGVIRGKSRYRPPPISTTGASAAASVWHVSQSDPDGSGAGDWRKFTCNRGTAFETTPTLHSSSNPITADASSIWMVYLEVDVNVTFLDYCVISEVPGSLYLKAGAYIAPTLGGLTSIGGTPASYPWGPDAYLWAFTAPTLPHTGSVTGTFRCPVNLITTGDDTAKPWSQQIIYPHNLFPNNMYAGATIVKGQALWITFPGPVHAQFYPFCKIGVPYMVDWFELKNLYSPTMLRHTINNSSSYPGMLLQGTQVWISMDLPPHILTPDAIHFTNDDVMTNTLPSYININYGSLPND